MRPPRAAGRTLSATQVAEFCDVDLKTIHNWADRGKIPGWRTPGRHLRFRRLDIVDFLRAYGFALPDALRTSRPDVMVVAVDAETLVWTRRTLSRRFELVTFGNVVEGLLALAATDPEVLLLGEVMPLDAAAIVAGVKASPAAAHVRAVTLGGDVPLASAWAKRGDGASLRDAMAQVTGVE